MILPRPADSFEWRGHPSRPSLVCRTLEPYARHVFTSEGWTLGRRAARDSDAGWREVADEIGVSDDALVRLRQVHGNQVVVATPGCHLAAADIIISDDPSLAIAVQSADCVPLLIADPDTGAVAAAHAGWRGMACGVPGAAVAAMAATFGSRAGSLVVALGPSIGACCYQVGPDVRKTFESAGFSAPDLDRWFCATPQTMSGNPRLASVAATPLHGRWFFDGWASVRDQLLAAGVEAGRIVAAGLCTASHPGVFCSYRRDGAPAGRMAAVIASLPRRP